MSLTVEALAKEIGRIYEGDDAWCRMVATGLLPFIERHIAAGQPPTPAELAAEYCRGRDDGWEAAEQKYRQPPKPAGESLFLHGAAGRSVSHKPAGAVPLPSIAPYVERLCRIFRDHPYDDTSAIVLRDYAREAAGRAGVVPEEWRNTVTKAAHAIAYAIYNLSDEKFEDLPPGIFDATDPASVALMAERDLRALLAAPPIPQQPEAECPKCGKVGVICKTPDCAMLTRPPAEPAAVNQSLTTEGAGGEVVGGVFVEYVDHVHGPKHGIRLLNGLHLEGLPPGTKLYTRPTPAADAGGVTAQRLRGLACRWTDSAMADKNSARKAAKLKCAADLSALTAAITPEVRHGE